MNSTFVYGFTFTLLIAAELVLMFLYYKEWKKERTTTKPCTLYKQQELDTMQTVSLSPFAFTLCGLALGRLREEHGFHSAQKEQKNLRDTPSRFEPETDTTYGIAVPPPELWGGDVRETMFHMVHLAMLYLDDMELSASQLEQAVAEATDLAGGYLPDELVDYLIDTMRSQAHFLRDQAVSQKWLLRDIWGDTSAPNPDDGAAGV